MTSDPVLVARRNPRAQLLHVIEAVLYWGGAAAAYVAVRRIKGAIVLMYHSVSSPSRARWIDPRNRIAARAFESQMRFLARQRKVISMDTLVEKLEAREDIEPRTVVLTFDDGYTDFLEFAIPVLVRYELPATLYLPTGLVARGENQSADDVYCAFRFRTRHALSLSELGCECVSLAERSTRSRMYMALCKRLQGLEPERRTAVVRNLYSALGPSEVPPRLTMSWDEVKEALRRHSLLSIGAHTVEHVDLPRCPEPLAAQEIGGSVEAIKSALGYRPRHFAFPYGSSCPRTRRLVKTYGFRAAVADGPEYLVCLNSPLFALPRLPAPSSLTLLRFRTSGAYPYLLRALCRRPRVR